MSAIQAEAGIETSKRMGRLFWTLLDQGAVSGGAFLIQIALARLLTPHDYGVFTLIFSALLTLQLVNATLLFYPMSVRIPRTSEAEMPRLLGASMLLVAAMSLLLALALGGGLAAFGLGDVVLPGFAYLVAWQVQEGMRRALFGSLRHRDAIPGDLVTYLLPAAVTWSIGLTHGISIAGTLVIMTGCAAIGACLHARALTLRMPTFMRLCAVASAFWRIGGLASLGNGMLYHTRLMIVPWSLALSAGPAAAAGFQAAMNIVNLSNPIILGVGNLIPQIVAGAQARGLPEAWRIARTYALIAGVPIAGYSLLICLWPGEAFWLLYGSGSPYLALELPLRLLVITGLIGFYVEAVLSFFHGASLVGRAAKVNLYGTISVLLLAIPAILMFGILGGCVALLAGNLLRLGCAQMALSQMHGPSRAVVA